MSVNINLAAAGVVGVTELSVGQLTPVDSGDDLQINTAYVLTGDGISNFILPDGITDPLLDLSGAVVKFKNLLTEVSPGVTEEVTIERGTGMIDGRADNWVTTASNDFVTFVWINDTIGWAAL